MYICICNGITDHQIRRAVADGACGADGVCTMLGVGAGCGCCREAADEVIAAAQQGSPGTHHRHHSTDNHA